MIRASVSFRSITATPADATLVPVAAVDYVLLSVSKVEFKYGNPVERQYELSFVLDTSKFDITKLLIDDVVPADNDVFSMLKPQTDGFELSDTDYIAFDKASTDAAVLSEDQSWNAQKPLTHYFGLGDQAEFAWHYRRSLSDSVEVSEQSSRQYISGEELIHLLDRTDSDSAGISETVHITTTSVRSFDELVSAGDVFLSTYTPSGYTDSSGIGDTAVPAFHKRLFDSVAFSEELTATREKPIFNDVKATDDLDGVFSPLDDQEIQFFKNRTDSASPSEQIIRLANYARGVDESVNLSQNVNKLTNKSRSDSAGCSDSGTLFYQDYSPGYFAEDYVGTVLRNF
jgi:hypothetical protein